MKAKRLIVPSLALLASLVLGVGTTYALFTAREENNIAITSGKVKLTSTLSDLELYSPTLINTDGSIRDDTNCATATNFYNGGSAVIDGGNLSLINISPGDKVSFKVKFDNRSNISIKYRVLCNDITEYTGTETYKLIDALIVKEGSNIIKYGYPLLSWTEITPNEAIDDMTVSVELPSTVGPEYSLLSSKLSFSVEAVQANTYVIDNVVDVNTICESEGSFSVPSFKYLKDKILRFEVIEEASIRKMALKEDGKIVSVFTPVNCEKVTFTIEGEEGTLAEWSVASSFEPVDYVVPGDVTIRATEGFCCILEGTLITMGDLSTKKVEDLRKGDEILSYNFKTGEYESTPIIYAYEETDYAHILEVTLDNGNVLNIVNSEDMFDVDSKRFFTVSSTNFQECVGKKVLTNVDGEKGYSEIISIENSFEVCTRYTVYSEGFQNYVASDALLLYCDSGFNEKYTITDDLVIDQEIFASDVAKYGLFTYDDFPTLDRYMFDAFDISTCTFLVGKGYITDDELNANINDFIDEYTEKYPLFLAK